ncbi:MAG: hypothetical protein JSS04_13960 [Proteobacteria bacterium]|nr:hypothetical protein [Pseudomonadota bacterium]
MRRRIFAALLVTALPSIASAQHQPPTNKDRGSGNNGNKSMSNTSKGGGGGPNVNHKFDGKKDNKKGSGDQ